MVFVPQKLAMEGDVSYPVVLGDDDAGGGVAATVLWPMMGDWNTAKVHIVNRVFKAGSFLS